MLPQASYPTFFACEACQLPDIFNHYFLWLFPRVIPMFLMLRLPVFFTALGMLSLLDFNVPSTLWCMSKCWECRQVS